LRFSGDGPGIRFGQNAETGPDAGLETGVTVKEPAPASAKTLKLGGALEGINEQ
jgi:hypothetical protein